MARLIQGTLKFPDGSPISGATIRFIASKFIYTGVPVGVSHDFNTDTFGYYSESILEGSYHVFFKQSGHDVFTHLTDAILAPLVDGNGVPLGDPSTLEDIIGENLPEEPVYAGCGDVPSPSSFTVTGAFTTIILGWEGTAYTCHDVTEIWVNTVDDLATASFLDTTQASVYSHALGNDAAVYYWIRFRNKNDVTGNWFSTAGKFAQTAQDPGRVLADLQQDIYDSQLFSDLRTSINTNFYQVTEPTSRPNGEDLVSGDTWINASTNQRYIWDTSQQPPEWVAVTDREVYDAVTRLTNTEEVADGQIKGFFQATEPLDVESFFGDIWIDIGQASPLTAAAIYRYEADDGSSTGTLSWRTAPANALGLSFIKAHNADAAITDILTGATDLGTAVIGNTNLVSYITGQVDAGVDNMVRVFSGDNRTEQTGMEEGDLYNETSTVAGVTTTTTYRYSGNSWVEVQGASNVEQLSDLTDGKRAIYTQGTVPTDADAKGNLTIEVNDLWFPVGNVVVTEGGVTTTYEDGQIYRCTRVNPIVFEKATKYHDIIEALEESLVNSIDSKIQTYVETSAPYANSINVEEGSPEYITARPRVNDLWLCTATAGSYTQGKYYAYVESANADTPTNFDYTWVEQADITATLATLVNNKRTIYNSSTAPDGTAFELLDNDLWIPPADVYDTDGVTLLYTAKEMYAYNSATASWLVASRYSADIADIHTRFNDYVTAATYNNNIADIQNQIDGNITTWFGDTDPTLSNYPSENWEEVDSDINEYNDYVNHIGDVFYNRATGQAFRFVYEDIDGDDPDLGIHYHWVLITDNTIAAALSLAQDAEDLADNKRRVFVSEPIAPYDIGDLWDRGSTVGVWRCNASRATGYTPILPATTEDDWQVIADKTGDNIAASILNQGDLATLSNISLSYVTDAGNLASLDEVTLSLVTDAGALAGVDEITEANLALALKGLIDGKAEQWYQTTDPASNWATDSEKLNHVGDMWYDTTVGALTLKIYIITSTDPYVFDWDTVHDQEAIDAATAASVAQETADGKVNLFTDDPVGPYSIGDLWDRGSTLGIWRCTVDRETVDSPTNYDDEWQVMADRTADNTAAAIVGQKALATLDNITLAYVTDAGNLASLDTAGYSNLDATLQGRIDGKVELWFYEVDPTLTNEPYTLWDTAEYTVHVGDVYYNTVDNKAFRFVSNGDPATYSWVQIQDADAIQALADAAEAQTAADKRAIVFTAEPTTPYQVGDIWAQGSAGDIKTCTTARESGSFVSTDWVLATKYTDDSAVINVVNGTTDMSNADFGGQTLSSFVSSSISTATENMVNVYSGAPGNQPTTGINVGDLYIETNTAGIVTIFRYSDLNTTPVTYGWVEIEGSSNVAALADLTDGKRTIYTTPGVPKDTDAQGNLTIKINDLWIPTANICTDDTTGVVVACGTNGSSIAYRAEEIYRCTTETIYAADGTTISAHPVFVAATRYHDLIESLDENLQAQIDNKIQTYAQGTLPYANNVDTPLNVTLDSKVGDLWLCTADITIDNTEYSNGSYYEYSRTANGANYDYSWTLKADITSGLSELVNNKRTIYGGSTIPAGTPQPLLANDLWIPTTNVTDSGTTYKQGEMYTWTGSTWDLASRYSADILALSDRTIFVFYLPGGVYTESTDSFETPPTLDTDAGIPAPEVNDLWVITDRDDEVRRYNGSVWELLHVATLANVDTKITEATSYCRNTSGNITYHTTESACTTAGHTWVEGGAIAALQNTVSTTIGDSTTTIQELADSTDGLEAQYTVKIDNNGHVSGFGLASTPVDGTPYSFFIVAADNFAVTGTDETPVTPFIVNTGGTAGTCYINGIANPTYTNQADCEANTGSTWVAANTGIVGVDGSLVVNGTLNASAITAGTIGADHIGVETIDTTHIDTNSVFTMMAQSPDYVAGSQGWKIGNGGDVEFASGNFRGDITGASGTFTGSLNLDGGTGDRLIIKDDVISVVINGVVRVKIGDLS